MTEQSTRAEIDEARRDRRVWTTLIILGVLVAAGTLALGWRLVEGRLAAAKQLDRAVALLKESDATVVAVDEVVRATVSTATAAKAADLAPRVEAARSQLSEAGKLAGAGFERLTDDEQKKARLVQDASNARLEMLGHVPAILSAKRRAATAEALAADAWAETLAANGHALESVAGYNKLKRAGMQAASASNKKAKTEFTAARDLFDRAALAFPEAQLGAFSIYIDDRLKLVALSKKAGDAWLAGRIEEANRLGEEYNKIDEVALERAKRLPGTPASAIGDAYEAQIGKPMGEYYRARQKATDADSVLTTL